MWTMSELSCFIVRWAFKSLQVAQEWRGSPDVWLLSDFRWSLLVLGSEKSGHSKAVEAPKPQSRFFYNIICSCIAREELFTNSDGFHGSDSWCSF